MSEFKSKYATLLNALDEMQQSIAYAARKSVLWEAEVTIVNLETANESLLAAALSPAMTWTSEKPVKAGNYWWRENQAYSEKIVSVTSSYAGKSYVYFPGQSSGKDLDNVFGEWAGPLEPPQ